MSCTEENSAVYADQLDGGTEFGMVSNNFYALAQPFVAQRSIGVGHIEIPLRYQDQEPGDSWPERILTCFFDIQIVQGFPGGRVLSTERNVRFDGMGSKFEALRVDMPVYLRAGETYSLVLTQVNVHQPNAEDHVFRLEWGNLPVPGQGALGQKTKNSGWGTFSKNTRPSPDDRDFEENVSLALRICDYAGDDERRECRKESDCVFDWDTHTCKGAAQGIQSTYCLVADDSDGLCTCSNPDARAPQCTNDAQCQYNWDHESSSDPDIGSFNCRKIGPVTWCATPESQCTSDDQCHNGIFGAVSDTGASYKCEIGVLGATCTRDLPGDVVWYRPNINKNYPGYKGARACVPGLDCGGMCGSCGPNATCFQNKCVCNKDPNLDPTQNCAACFSNTVQCGSSQDDNIACLPSDKYNCGTCGNECALEYETCNGATCTCPPGLKYNADNTACVCQNNELMMNPATSCKSCLNGGEPKCGCTNLNTDASNCNTCGNQCAEGQLCNEGQCRCIEGSGLCGGVCVDYNQDEANCGGCVQDGQGVVCGSRQECVSRECVDTSCDENQLLCNKKCSSFCVDSSTSGLNVSNVAYNRLKQTIDISFAGSSILWYVTFTSSFGTSKSQPVQYQNGMIQVPLMMELPMHRLPDGLYTLKVQTTQAQKFSKDVKFILYTL
jgi:hypothetical protein